ncbi:YdeI/OmpD-associated family protein [Rathayibacter soli]|uniref:YdeI/OmpD-associated family protein n=1 Tax=Rathayibacter soli TaxID=3144168 RepID=UPI0027E58840|nr:YdeI/OmpD-associated family protein [Glaciibacter superstes]
MVEDVRSAADAGSAVSAVVAIDAQSFERADQWEAWLVAHHADSDGVWLKIGKKGSKKVAITIREAADLALCYGWIDSIRRGLDNDYFLQRYSPRRPRGAWSRVNVERVEQLSAEGRMREPGLAEVAAAQADGRWDAAYASQSAAIVPGDVTAALAANTRARERFERLSKTDRYLAMLPVLKARTPSGRQARIDRLVGELAAGTWRGSPSAAGAES